MARIRSLKPDYFLDEGLSEVSLEAHFLLSGLWTVADRAGRLEDRPRRIKVQVFPYRDVDVDRALGELAAAGYVVRYEAAGKRLLQVADWERDQRPHFKEAESLFPAPAYDYTEHQPGPGIIADEPGKHSKMSPGGIPEASQTSRVGSGNRDLGIGIRDPEALAGVAVAPPPDAQVSHSDAPLDELPEADPADVLEAWVPMGESRPIPPLDSPIPSRGILPCQGANSSESPNGSTSLPEPSTVQGGHKLPANSPPPLRLEVQQAAKTAQEPRQRAKQAWQDPEALQALWNELAPPKGLQRWERMSDARRRSARLSLEAVPDLAKWRGYLEAKFREPFYLGADGGWKADVDWLLRVERRDQVADFDPAHAGPRRQHNLPIPAGAKPPTDSYPPGRPKLPTLEEAKRLGMIK